MAQAEWRGQGEITIIKISIRILTKICLEKRNNNKTNNKTMAMIIIISPTIIAITIIITTYN